MEVLKKYLSAISFLLILMSLGGVFISCESYEEKDTRLRQEYLSSGIDQSLVLKSPDWIAYEDGTAFLKSYLKGDSTYSFEKTYLLNVSDGKYYPFRMNKDRSMNKIMAEECGSFRQVNDSVLHNKASSPYNGWYKLKGDFYFPFSK